MSIVFVDDLRKPVTVGKITTFQSRLFAYPADEKTLVSFAQRLGLWKKRLNPEGTPGAYFAVSDAMRIKAIDAGAAECSVEEAVAMMRKGTGR